VSGRNCERGEEEGASCFADLHFENEPGLTVKCCRRSAKQTVVCGSVSCHYYYYYYYYYHKSSVAHYTYLAQNTVHFFEVDVCYFDGFEDEKS